VQEWNGPSLIYREGGERGGIKDSVRDRNVSKGGGARRREK